MRPLSAVALTGSAARLGIARRYLDLGVSQELADHRQPLAGAHRGRGEGVSEVMDADILKPGTGANALPERLPLLDRLPDAPLSVVGDKNYSADALREHIWSLGARPAIPHKRNEESVCCPDWTTNRNIVERLWARLKEWRAVANRYEKTAASLTGGSAALGSGMKLGIEKAHGPRGYLHGQIQIHLKGTDPIWKWAMGPMG